MTGPDTVALVLAGGDTRQVLGIRGARLTSLLDPGPLHRTMRGWVDFAQIEANLRSGDVDAAAVVATSALTGRSVVFHCGAARPEADARRGIDYVPTPLGEEHVLASSAIPVAFPAIHVSEPEFARVLIAMGRQDATRWRRSNHDGDALWQEGPLPGGGA